MCSHYRQNEGINDIISRIHAGESLPESVEQWTRKPYTRKELNALCRLDMDMDEIDGDGGEEIIKHAKEISDQDKL